jgi:hypothetical protein
MTQIEPAAADEAQPTALQTTDAGPPMKKSAGAGLPVLALLDPIANNVSLEELWYFASTLARSEIVPDALQGKPANVFAVMMRGLELGITPMTAVCEINLIKGKTSLSSARMVARVLQSGKAKVFKLVESSGDRAVVRVQRHEWTEARDVEFTMEEARAMGLHLPRGVNKNPSPYVTQGANMLRRRVFARASREHFPDVIIAYDPDELAGEAEVQSAPSTFSAPPPAAETRAAPEPGLEQRKAEVAARAAAAANANAPAAEPPPPAEPPVDKTMAPSTLADAGADPDKELVLGIMADLAAAKNRADVEAAGRRAKPLKERAEAGDVDAKALYDDVLVAYRVASQKFPKQKAAAK